MPIDESPRERRLCDKGYRSSGDGGSLPPGPCGQIYSCQPVEWRCFSCLQKSSFGYLRTTLSSSLFFVMGLVIWSSVYKPVSLEFLVCFNDIFLAIKNVPCYIWRGQGTCQNADKVTFIWVERSSSHLPEASHWIWTSASSLIILRVCRYGWLRWVIPRPTIFLTCFMYSCITQRSEIVPLHSSPLQAEALCGSCYLGLLFPPWFDPRGCGRTDSGYQTGHRNHFALTVDAPPGDDHLGRRDIMA